MIAKTGIVKKGRAAVIGKVSMPRWLGLAALVAAHLMNAHPARSQDAVAILKAMSDYIGSQRSISLSFDADIEVITPDIQKIQFASSGQVQLQRPDKLHAKRTGGYADVELVFDGQVLTLYGKNLNAFAQVASPGSVDQLIDRLRSEFNVALPGADLLLSQSAGELMADVIEAKHIGRGIIDGVECEHLAFRGIDTDWQIWIEVGNRPIPRKYVITTKTLAAAPQYALRIKDWRSDMQFPPDAFTFKASPGSAKVDLTALSGLDEVPHGAVTGGRK